VHAPQQVFADPAVAIAGGADAVTGIEVLRDREALFGAVASMPPRHGGCWTGSMSRTWSGCGRRGGRPGAGLAGADAGRGKACGCDWCGESAAASLNATAAVVPDAVRDACGRWRPQR
jgi:hypothetical protein